MKCLRTKKAEIFALPLEGLLPNEWVDKVRLIYAPLADSAVIVKTEQWNLIADHIDKGVMVDYDIVEVAQALCNVDAYAKLEASKVHHEHDFNNLTLLPTDRCNFSCDFCYSAKGRSKAELNEKAAFTAIDFFICEKSDGKLTLSILGGGEPLMSWRIVRNIIEYAEKRAIKYHKQLSISITTNGSLLNDEMIIYLRDHRIVTVISYEVLESIQNLHRGHYNEVKSNILRMFELKYTPQFNTVITPANVKLIPEIVATAHKDFPEIRYICADPVILPELFQNTTELKQYHDDYISGFYEARALGLKWGIKIDCTANISMDCTLARYCPGEMGVTAHGYITLCPCISSEKEPYFDDFIYGHVTEHDVIIDQDKLKSLLRKDGFSEIRCVDCAMKYNCAGGCIHKNKLLSPEFKSETCRFTNEFGRRFLYERIENTFKKEYGDDLLTLMQNELSK